MPVVQALEVVHVEQHDRDPGARHVELGVEPAPEALVVRELGERVDAEPLLGGPPAGVRGGCDPQRQDRARDQQRQQRRPVEQGEGDDRERRQDRQLQRELPGDHPPAQRRVAGLPLQPEAERGQGERGQDRDRRSGEHRPQPAQAGPAQRGERGVGQSDLDDVPDLVRDQEVPGPAVAPVLGCADEGGELGADQRCRGAGDGHQRQRERLGQRLLDLVLVGDRRRPDQSAHACGEQRGDGQRAEHVPPVAGHVAGRHEQRRRHQRGESEDAAVDAEVPWHRRKAVAWSIPSVIGGRPTRAEGGGEGKGEAWHPEVRFAAHVHAWLPHVSAPARQSALPHHLCFLSRSLD